MDDFSRAIVAETELEELKHELLSAKRKIERLQRSRNTPGMNIIILMGLPGSGKSTWIKDNTFGHVVVCSGDHHHEKADGYHYNFDEIAIAHAKSLMHYCEAFGKLRPDFLVVDNTNTQIWEIAPYIQIAYMHSVIDKWVESLRIVMLDTSLATCLERQTHGVPREVMVRMSAQLTRTVAEWPRHWPKVELTLDGVGPMGDA